MHKIKIEGRHRSHAEARGLLFSGRDPTRARQRPAGSGAGETPACPGKYRGIEPTELSYDGLSIFHQN